LNEQSSDAANIDAEHQCMTTCGSSAAAPATEQNISAPGDRDEEMFQHRNHRSGLPHRVLFKGTIDRTEPGVDPATRRSIRASAADDIIRPLFIR
jgi:hypothetical protein